MCKKFEIMRHTLIKQTKQHINKMGSSYVNLFVGFVEELNFVQYSGSN